METKYVRVPFEVELAKKITDKSVDGRIVTNLGKEVRIVCFDMLNEKYPIVGLRKDDNYTETALSFNLKGQCLQILEDNDLFLEVPEYMTFKDGDLYTTITGDVGIYNSSYKSASGTIPFYVGMRNDGELIFRPNDCAGFGWITESRLSTESEKQKLIDALKESKEPKAKEYLKRFFGIEEKKECEFKSGQPVIGIDGRGEWRYDFFSHYKPDRNIGNYVCTGRSYNKCLPYNEETAHLLGTTDNYQ